MPYNPPMRDDRPTETHLRRAFTASFTARDVAEPLLSFGAEQSAGYVSSVMAHLGRDYAGVRKGGVTVGYVEQRELTEGTCEATLRFFDHADVVADDAPLATLVERLDDRPRVFVKSLGNVCGLVTRGELQKPPVRMWLFGMITLLEMGLTSLIQRHHPDGAWRQLVPEGRLRKAEELLAERRRRHRSVDLLDCLQLADKGYILLKAEATREALGVASRSLGKKRLKGLEALRNNLAHSQDIVTLDWEAIARLSANLERILEM